MLDRDRLIRYRSELEKEKKSGYATVRVPIEDLEALIKVAEDMARAEIGFAVMRDGVWQTVTRHRDNNASTRVRVVRDA